jgi:hypothetical protein
LLIHYRRRGERKNRMNTRLNKVWKDPTVDFE